MSQKLLLPEGMNTMQAEIDRRLGESLRKLAELSGGIDISTNHYAMFIPSDEIDRGVSSMLHLASVTQEPED